MLVSVRGHTCWFLREGTHENLYAFVRTFRNGLMGMALKYILYIVYTCMIEINIGKICIHSLCTCIYSFINIETVMVCHSTILTLQLLCCVHIIID